MVQNSSETKNVHLIGERCNSLCLSAFQRRDGDSNPGTALDGYTLSRRAPQLSKVLFINELRNIFRWFASYLQVFRFWHLHLRRNPNLTSKERWKGKICPEVLKLVSKLEISTDFLRIFEIFFLSLHYLLIITMQKYIKCVCVARKFQKKWIEELNFFQKSHFPPIVRSTIML